MPLPERKKARGRPIEWSDADLDRLAQVSEADVEAARVFWRANAPGRYDDLLDARPEEDSLLPEAIAVAALAFLWRENERRYVTSITLRTIQPDVVRRVYYEVAGAGRSAMIDVSGAFMNGRITLAEWQLEMAKQIKLVHTTAAAGAQGGWLQMSQADWGYTGNLLKNQYGFLDNFAAEVASGQQPLNGRFVRRAGMYGDAGRGSYESMRGRLHRDAGFTEAQRVLGAADHCVDCVDWAGVWKNLAEIEPIGSSVCRSNCACSIIYRSAAGEVSEEA